MAREHEIRYCLEESHHSLVAMAAFAHGADIVEYAREAVVRRATADLKELHPQLQELILRELGVLLAETGTAYRKKRGRIPEREEAIAHYQAKKYTFDFERWWAFYESNGWKVGKNPVSKWQATMVTFERSESAFKGTRRVEHVKVDPQLDLEAAEAARNRAATQRIDSAESRKIAEDLARIAAERKQAR